MGKWYAEYDENGKCTKTVYDEGYLRLIGTENIDETDSENRWRDIIHPDDMQTVDNCYRNVFRKQSEGLDYDLECRMLSGPEYHWFHLFGHCSRREDGSVSYIDGVLFDVQNIVDGQEAQKELSQNNIRLFALEDNFEALYDVNLRTGTYVSYSKGDFYQNNITAKLASPDKFFEGMRENVDRVVFEDDREATFAVQQKENIIRTLSEKEYIDHYYRVITENGLMWLKMRIVYKDSDRKNVILGVFNAEKEMSERQKEEKFRDELVQTNTRLFALEDNFESMYDVEIESGKYTSFVKGDFYREIVNDKLVSETDYFEDLKANIDAVIYEEDRDALYKVLSRKGILEKLEKDGRLDHYYRINSESGPVWFKVRVVYKDAEKKNVIIGAFNASEEMALKQKEAELIKETETQLQHEKLRTAILNYSIEYDGDPVELLKQFAEPLRALIGCDQVVYRDLEETRIMVNSSAIENDWAVPLEYCRQCPHFDAHHPMYENGYTEMENCQQGWNGIPVYHDCPIKSSLTRIVYCDNEPAGYIAIHFVKDYHRFDDAERITLEVFARILSMAISRYTARQRAGEFDSVKKNLDMMFSLADEFNPIIVLDPDTGEYDLMRSKANEVEELTTLTVHGGSLYKDIGIDATSIIHENEREQFRAFHSRENMMKIAETGEMQESESRWKVGPNGEYLWKYSKAVRMLDDNGKAYVVIGVIDTTESKEKEREYREANEKIKEANLSNALVLSFVNGIKWTYTINENNEVVAAQYDDNAHQIFDIDHPGNPLAWTELIHPDDRENVMNSFREALSDRTGEKQYDFAYRLKDNRGRYQWSKVTGRVICGEDGTRELTGITIDITEQMEKEHKHHQELHEALAFTTYFLDTYISAYYVCFDDLSCQIYKRTDELEKDYPIVDDYFESLTEYIGRDVHPEDREGLFKMVIPDTMKAILEENNEYSHIFRDISGNKEKYYRMQVIRGADENHAAFGFIDITNEINEKKSREKEAEESRKLIETVSASYNAAFMVNMTDSSIVMLRMDDSLMGHDRHFSDFESLREFFVELLPESDRDAMRTELDFGTIREKLTSVSSYNTEYRIRVNGATIWEQMNITRIDDENFAAGLAIRDVEITKKHLEDRRYSEYFALYEIDIETGMMKIVKDSPYYGLDRSGTAMPFAPAMKSFAAGLDDEPRKFFEQFADLNYVKEQFTNEDKLTYAYRSNNVNDKDWVDCTCYVTHRNSDGTPSMFTFGFSLIDSLGVYRQELHSKYREALEEISEEKRRNDILHDIINSGKWSFKVSDDDEIIDAYYSEEAKKIVNNDLSQDILNWTDILHPDDKEEALAGFMATVRDHSGNTPYDTTYRMIDRNGEYHWYHSAGRIIRNEDGSGEFFGIHIDITNQIEEQLVVQEQLAQARNAAEEANRAKTSFLFNMSHDIRTPMNAITGFTTMAKKHIDNREKTADYLDKIDSSGQQLLALINQVLEMARIESGKIELDENHVTVHEEFYSTVTVLDEQAKVYGLDFSYSLANIKHDSVLADTARMSSITLNVVGNAMKYTPKGGRVEFRLEEIPARKAGYATFVLTVADTGIGMSEEYQKVLFEPFTREKNSTVSKIQGTGLGMSIVKELVELMGGNIKVRSELGKGTRFDITLDFRIDEELPTGKEEPAGTVMASLSGKKVLLVEDNELNREIAIDILDEEGLEVDEAEDGTYAVEILKEKGPDYYDFVLMDIQMPIMNGYEATKAIRAMYPDAGLPIIALSANAFAEDKARSIAAGMNDHVSKPINVEELKMVMIKFM